MYHRINISFELAFIKFNGFCSYKSSCVKISISQMSDTKALFLCKLFTFYAVIYFYSKHSSSYRETLGHIESREGCRVSFHSSYCSDAIFPKLSLVEFFFVSSLVKDHSCIAWMLEPCLCLCLFLFVYNVQIESIHFWPISANMSQSTT